MGTWYRDGTIAVTNGSATVIGAGTTFIATVQIGDALHAPDGNIYEIVTVNSNVVLTIAPVYLGGAQSGQAYVIQPTRGWTRRVLEQIAEASDDVDTMLEGPGAGKFPDGTLSQPGMRFRADEDTGTPRISANRAALVAGGADKLIWSSNGIEGNVVSDAATLAVDAINHRVGMGTLTPDGPLHVHAASAGSVAAAAYANQLVPENDSHGGLSILTPDNATAYLLFGDQNDNTARQRL